MRSERSFHDRIAELVGFTSADAIFEMPEMQAIRTWMAWASSWLEYIDEDGAEPELPASVISWVDAE